MEVIKNYLENLYAARHQHNTLIEKTPNQYPTGWNLCGFLISKCNRSVLK